ncbi:hypothetical protein CLV42_115132 [Chitinophaga ginsengisoli]|uniref:Uncharacterized protein n=1 Tax=Chitinophaga ginsengisoli TaxID=363837 RepID=A0A2P8FSC1_9BACT|nr:hypothetical protein CLV42_115132 [Chitinophaga ginsengisoli]
MKHLLTRMAVLHSKAAMICVTTQIVARSPVPSNYICLVNYGP